MEASGLVARTTLKVCDDLKADDSFYFVVGIAPNQQFVLICEHDKGEGVGPIKRITMEDALKSRREFLIDPCLGGFDSAEVG